MWPDSTDADGNSDWCSKEQMQTADVLVAFETCEQIAERRCERVESCPRRARCWRRGVVS